MNRSRLLTLLAAWRPLLPAVWLVLGSGLVCSDHSPSWAASADNVEQAEGSSSFDRYWEEIRESFEVVARGIVYGALIDSADSAQNPDNNFLNLPDKVAVAEARPDFSLKLRGLDILVKPRAQWQLRSWDEGGLTGENEDDTDFFVNEWLVRLRLLDSLHVSYGRENVQWGPAWFISPSNPFFRNNGQSNPKLEVPGMEFARLLWIPDSSWTLSFMANLGEGRQEFINEEFEKVYGMKLDYVTMQKYFSLIASYREHDRAQLGGYFNWSVNDALMIYGEGSLTPGTHALYPKVLLDTPWGPLVGMDAAKEDDNTPQALALMGASYTLVLGPTLSSEYIFNTAGYSDHEADLYYDLRDQAARGLGSSIEIIDQLARYGLLQTLDPRQRLLRKNYLMVQYRHSFIWNVLNLVLRTTVNLDDSSSQLIPIVEYDLGNHAQLFLIGQKTFGPRESEYRSLVDYSWMFGIEYTF